MKTWGRRRAGVERSEPPEVDGLAAHVLRPQPSIGLQSVPAIRGSKGPCCPPVCPARPSQRPCSTGSTRGQSQRGQVLSAPACYERTKPVREALVSPTSPPAARSRPDWGRVSRPPWFSPAFTGTNEDPMPAKFAVTKVPFVPVKLAVARCGVPGATRNLHVHSGLHQEACCGFLVGTGCA